MGKKITSIEVTLPKTDEKFELGFNRETAVRLSNQGFDPRMLGSNPIAQGELLFIGAFRLNHNNISRKRILEIYDTFADKTDLLVALAEIYQNLVEELFESNVSEDEQAKWVAH